MPSRADVLLTAACLSRPCLPIVFALCRRLSAVVVVVVVVRKVYIAPLLILTLAVKILLCEIFVCGE